MFALLRINSKGLKGEELGVYFSHLNNHSVLKQHRSSEEDQKLQVIDTFLRESQWDLDIRLGMGREREKRAMPHLWSEQSQG